MAERPRMSRRELRLLREQQRRAEAEPAHESAVPRVSSSMAEDAALYDAFADPGDDSQLNSLARESSAESVAPVQMPLLTPDTTPVPTAESAAGQTGSVAQASQPDSVAPASHTGSPVPASQTNSVADAVPALAPTPATAPAQPAKIADVSAPEQMAPIATASPQPTTHDDGTHYPVAPKKRRRRFDVISWFGELLVTVGVVLGLFAFWQVFVTDMQVEADTELALNKFYKNVDCPSNVSKDKRTDIPPEIQKPEEGSTFGALHIPKWEFMVLPLAEGTDHTILDKAAAGHYDATALPGQIGNFSVAAHRRSYGSSFRYIDTLAEGDPVIVETKDAWMVYRVASHQIVDPGDKGVIFPVPNKRDATPEEQLMTMTTCHPEYGNSERFIVHLKFDYWTPHDAGIPAELKGRGHPKCT